MMQFLLQFASQEGAKLYQPDATKLEKGPVMAQERIYIGGLSPPRLSGRDILRRLKSLDKVQIESSSLDKDCDDYFESGGKPYLHITAISKDESASAIDIIHKHYHNVKWKGCKLIVELAKPHFLERLEQERLDREKEKAKVSAQTISEDPETNPVEEASRIPRRLRVRKKHGDIAVHIDTKPWTVETWSRFHKARSKLKQREEKHHANVIASSNNNNYSKEESVPSPGPLMHRAVHIRFSTQDSSSSMNGNGRVRPSKEHDDVGGVISDSESSSSSSSSSSSESESESESSRGSIDKNRQSSTKQSSERYEWSDDDSDSDDSETDNTSMHKTINHISKNPVEQDGKKETYHWSTDEDSEEDDQENIKPSFPSRGKQQLKPVSGVQEFAAGFDDASTFSYDENKDFGDDEDAVEFNQGPNEDLKGDVTSNLNILSSIFPEMSNTKPVNPNSEEKSKADTESKSSSLEAKKNNSNLGIMPRFDPSAKSSAKYIVEDEEKEETNLSSEEKADEDAMDEGEPDKKPEMNLENDTKVKLPNVSTVYEQDKLENVFRNARDAWGDDTGATAPDNSTPNVNQETSSEKNSSFSFGFKLDNSDGGNSNSQQTSEGTSTNNGFSFSFNVPEPDPKDEKNISTGKDDSAMEQIDAENVQTGALESSANGSDDESAAETVVQRHKGLTLADEDLKKYVDNFFGCNDGVRIMQNPQDFMNDDKERVAWNSERQTLTLDWKRKRKYAITRIQKRMKVRRR